VLSPYAALLVKQAAGVVGGAGEAAAAPTEAYALWACPVAEERCRVWFTMYTSDAAVSDAELIDFETRIFTQDQPVLESQRPKRLPLSGGEAHGPADRLSVAYRRYLRDAGIRYGVC
jgi:phenylpropionate dioxygenase-like ring-hydroxylating dioxygenase large terminal subunit